VSEEALLDTLPRLPEATRLVAAAMFYTGARPGELFAMRVKSDHVIFIPDQVDRSGASRPTKTLESRDVLVDAKGWKWVQMFLARRSMIARNNRHSTLKKELGIKLYDLRHSFAIHMLNRGLSVSDVALLLGNSVTVCQTYYLGFVAKPESIEAMKVKMKNRP
jgi:integrase